MVDKIRVEVRKAQVARNLSDEQTMQLFQQNFEHSLDQLIGAIRNSFNVSRRPARVPHRLSPNRCRSSRSPNRCRSSRWAGAPYCGSTHHSSWQVTEKAMDTSFKQHQSDPDVQQAIQNMRVLSSNAGSASSTSNPLRLS